jgi:hypothetical protein
MTTPAIDLSRINVLTEILVRAGNAQAPNARQTFQKAYEDLDLTYPDAVGISTLVREGATLDELAREGAFPHKKISFSVIGKIVEELGKVGYEPVLYRTPTPKLPDHHSLAVAMKGIVQPMLSDLAADALLHALTVVDNPYRPRISSDKED